MNDRIAKLRSILESEPDDPFCLYGLALEYAKLGDHTSACAWFDRTIQADPDCCYAYFHKAKSLEESGDVVVARATLADGLVRARRAGDAKALGELQSYLDELS